MQVPFRRRPAFLSPIARHKAARIARRKAARSAVETKKGIPCGISFTLITGKTDYFTASASAAFSAQQVFVESHFSQFAHAVESHFSAQAAASPAGAATASVAAASVSAAFFVVLPPQLTMATAASTMTKEKIFFIASNILLIVLNAAKIYIRMQSAIKNFTFFTPAARYSSRSASESVSFLGKAFGKVAATLPFRMIASSAVRQFPTETENQGLSYTIYTLIPG